MLEEKVSGRLLRPSLVTSFPFAAARRRRPGVGGAGGAVTAPSDRASVVRVAPARGGTVVVDLAGSTPLYPVARLYRLVGSHLAMLASSAARAPSGRAVVDRGEHRSGRDAAR